MKTLFNTLIITILISLSSYSQKGFNTYESIFISIWNSHRSDNSIEPVKCYSQNLKIEQVSPSIKSLVMIPNGLDTTYSEFVFSGTTKYIPNYHDKNTKLLINESIESPMWDQISDSRLPNDYYSNPNKYKNLNISNYCDSLYLQDLFDSFKNNELYQGSLFSQNKIYISVISEIIKNGTVVKYTIKISEILDSPISNIPIDYGSTLVIGDRYTSKWAKYAVDRKTHKLINIKN